MNTFKKLMVAVILGTFGCAHAETVAPEAVAPETEQLPVQAEQKSVEPEVVQEQPVAVTPAAIVDDSQENQELEKYLQELSQEFEASDAKAESESK